MAEDQAEAADWNARKVEKGWPSRRRLRRRPCRDCRRSRRTTPAPPSTTTPSTRSAWRARQARDTRVYEGSLTKFGEGALTLSGDNSFSGGTELRGGRLVAASAHAFGTGDVDVFGGTLATRSAATGA